MYLYVLVAQLLPGHRAPRPGVVEYLPLRLVHADADRAVGPHLVERLHDAEFPAEAEVLGNLDSTVLYTATSTTIPLMSSNSTEPDEMHQNPETSVTLARR